MWHQICNDEEKGEELDEAVVESGAVAMGNIHQLLEDTHGSACIKIELHKTTYNQLILFNVYRCVLIKKKCGYKIRHAHRNRCPLNV